MACYRSSSDQGVGAESLSIVFVNKEDQMKILNGKAWTFDSQFLVLKQWKEGTDYLKESFNRIHLWVHVWNLPNHWISKDTGLKFKHLFSNVVHVIIPESGSKKGRYLKLLAEINLEIPLLSGTKIKCNDEEVWVDFQYENLAMFCFYCGKVGHSERMCSTRKADAIAGQVEEGQYGEWLKADVGRVGYRQSILAGKKIMEVDSNLGRERNSFRGVRGPGGQEGNISDPTRTEKEEEGEGSNQIQGKNLQMRKEA